MLRVVTALAALSANFMMMGMQFDALIALVLLLEDLVMMSMQYDTWIALMRRVVDGALVALRQVHVLGVLHGDVRLDNFVAVPVGEGRWRVVVLDFDRAYLGAGVEALREERAQLRRLLGLPCGVQFTGQP